MRHTHVTKPLFTWRLVYLAQRFCFVYPSFVLVLKIKRMSLPRSSKSLSGSTVCRFCVLALSNWTHFLDCKWISIYKQLMVSAILLTGWVQTRRRDSWFVFTRSITFTNSRENLYDAILIVFRTHGRWNKTQWHNATVCYIFPLFRRQLNVDLFLMFFAQHAVFSTAKCLYWALCLLGMYTFTKILVYLKDDLMCHVVFWLECNLFKFTCVDIGFIIWETDTYRFILPLVFILV